MKKIIIGILFLICILTKCFAQEEPDGKTTIDESTSIEKNGQKKEFPVDFFITFAPSLILNTESGEQSAVSPVVYPLSFGAVFFKEKKFSFQPRLSFFANYYLWYDGDAYPAEIENRTATVFHFMLDLPAVYTLKLKEKHRFEFSLGTAIDFTISVLSHGVTDSDAGYSGSAGSDTDEIRRYFWNNVRFIYLETSAAYLFSFAERLSIGPEFKFYLPCGQVFSGNGMNHSIFSLGAKICF